jgi:hypothetical protein
MRRLGVRRARITVTSLVLGGVSVLLFVISPLALARFSRGLPKDQLDRMGQIGQAYGGISALLAGIAAGGVAAALLVQIRQFKLSQAQGMRMMQIDLMKMLIDNPELRPLSPTYRGASKEARQRSIFTNLMFRYLELGYEVGYFSAPAVSRELRDQLGVAEIRQLWEKVRPFYAASARNEAQREFFEIMDSTYREMAPVRPSQAVPPRTHSKVSNRCPCRCNTAAIAIGVAIAGGVGTAILRRRVTNVTARR